MRTEDSIVTEIMQDAGEGYPADPEADDTYCLTARELENLIRKTIDLCYELTPRMST